MRSHGAHYGHSFPGEPVEIVNLRLTAQGVIPKPRIRRAEEPTIAPLGRTALKGHRPVCFQDADGFVSTPIYDRYALQAGACVAGPAILEEFDSTVVIHPGYEGNVDAFGSIHRPARNSLPQPPLATPERDRMSEGGHDRRFSAAERGGAEATRCSASD